MKSEIGKINLKNMSSWSDLVIIRNNRVIKVDWEADFSLKDFLDNVKEYKESKAVFKEISNLYSFLHDKRVILNLSSPDLSPAARKLAISPSEYKVRIEDNAWFRDYYKTGPKHNGIIYCFNKLYIRIAQDWVEACNKHDPKKEAFLSV